MSGVTGQPLLAVSCLPKAVETAGKWARHPTPQLKQGVNEKVKARAQKLRRAAAFSEGKNSG